MSDPFVLDAALPRSAMARSAALARVEAVSRAGPSSPVDPARVTDWRRLEIPRPDPSAIAIADVTQFRSLVYAPAPLGRADLAAATAGPIRFEAAPGPTTPADRIVGTLAHLRGLHGL